MSSFITILIVLVAVIVAAVLFGLALLVAFATWVFFKVDLGDELGGDRWEDL